MTAVLLALGASVAWGSSDFLAGLKSRAVPVLSVLLVSQAAGLALARIESSWPGQPPALSAT